MALPRTLQCGLLALAMLAGAAAAHAQQAPAAPAGGTLAVGSTLTGKATVIEGSILSINGSQVRLEGIDAPNPGQTCQTLRGQSYDCYQRSIAAMKLLIGGKPVSCKIIDVPQLTTPRLDPVAHCSVNGKDLAAGMIVIGWAFAYQSMSPEYDRLQAIAQSMQYGMWGGRVTAPWIWRDQQQAAKAK